MQDRQELDNYYGYLGICLCISGMHVHELLNYLKESSFSAAYLFGEIHPLPGRAVRLILTQEPQLRNVCYETCV